MLDPEHNSQIIIAGASVRSLAQSAITAGLKPICIDLFCDSDLRQLVSDAGLPASNVRLISDFNQLESSLSDIDQRIPLVPVGGLEFFGEELDRIRSERPVFAIASNVISELRNPQILFPLLRDAGLPVPDFHCGLTFHSGSTSHSGSAEDRRCEKPPSNLAGNWLKKDSLSSGGHAVSRISVSRISGPDLQHTASRLKPSEYLQQEVQGIPCSATFLAAESQAPMLLGCAIQLCAEPALNATGFQFCGNAGPVQFCDTTTKQLMAIARCLCKRWPMKGVFGIDFIWNDGQISVIEINPRLTASHEIHEDSTPSDRSHLLQHCFTFQSPTVNKPRSPKLTSRESQPRLSDTQLKCRFILYSDRTFAVTPKQHSHMMQHRLQTNQHHASLWYSDIPEANPSEATSPYAPSNIAAGSPFCSINLTANNSENLSTTWHRSKHQLTPILNILNHQSMSALICQLQNRIEAIQDFTR